MRIVNSITEDMEYDSAYGQERVESLHGDAEFHLDLTSPEDLKLLRSFLDEDTFTNWAIEETNKLVENATVESVTWEVSERLGKLVITTTPDDWTAEWLDADEDEDWDDEEAA